ncbi:MAG: hypothetical protein HYR74_00780 [Candidatus Eisenbacteria bacterium]|nr:hypothetical protein [Candidatus Eisenbacteria bacterium]
MTPQPPPVTESPPPSIAGGVGLRLRLWLGCVGGALVAAAGMWWVIGAHTGPGAQLDVALLVWWLSAIAVLGVIVGLLFALWLDRGIIGHLRGLITSLSSGRVADLRGLPAGAGWGELSELTQALQALLTHHRHATRATHELGVVRQQIGMLSETLERWSDTERWLGVRAEPGLLAPVVETLDRGLRRLDEVRDQNLEAVRQVGGAAGHTLGEARDASAEAERGFVEATALLTTVRELQRLTGELGQSLANVAAAPVPALGGESFEAFRAVARGAIEELIASSTGSVEHLGRGLARVQEIADQVHLVANRATLIALSAALASTRRGGAETENTALSDEVKRLAAEVRSATERTTRLSQEVEGEIAAAAERMRGVRERVASRLAGPLAAVPAAAAAAPSGEASRLLERVREMIQDATQKGERLSAAGERVSRAAERLVRRLEEEVQEVEGLVVRLSPAGTPEAPDAPAAGLPVDIAPAPRESGSRPAGLRLLGEEHLLPGDPPPGARRIARRPGAGEERS